MDEKVLRVNQLDACELDDALTTVLQRHLSAAFKPLQLTPVQKFMPEMKALLRLCIWKFSLSRNHFTLGQEMIGLQYRGTGQSLNILQKSGLFVATVLLEWLLERADTMTWYFSKPSRAQKYISWAICAVKTLSLINFIKFLIYGTYPTLKENLLGVHIKPARPQSLREVSNVYLTREILWHGFSEFVFFVLPHINVFLVHNTVRKFLGIRSRTNTNCCGFCEAPPTQPHLSNCGHVYCYYCLKSNMIADPNFPCSVCNNPVTTCVSMSDVL